MCIGNLVHVYIVDNRLWGVAGGTGAVQASADRTEVLLPPAQIVESSRAPPATMVVVAVIAIVIHGGGSVSLVALTVVGESHTVGSGDGLIEK